MNTNENTATASNVSEIATATKGKPGRKPGSTVAKVIKPSLSFVSKFADGTRIEVNTEVANVKIGGFAPVTATIYKFDDKNEIVEGDEKKSFGAKAEEYAVENFGKYVAAVIAGTYKFPSEE